MRHRAVRAALALFVAVAVAAAAQEFCPPLPVLRLKPPLLLAVAVRYGLRRETGWAVVAALWCGLLEDALGFVPCGVSPAVFGAAALLCALVLRSQLVEGPAAVALVAGAAAPVAAFAQYLALRLGFYALVDDVVVRAEDVREQELVAVVVDVERLVNG